MIENLEFVFIPAPEEDGIFSLISMRGSSIVRFIFLSPDNSDEIGISALTFLNDTRFLEVIASPVISFIAMEGGKRDIEILLKFTLSGNCLLILSTIYPLRKKKARDISKSIKKNRL